MKGGLTPLLPVVGLSLMPACAFAAGSVSHSDPIAPARTDIRTLQKYMGRQAARQFLEFHRVLQPEWRKVS